MEKNTSNTKNKDTQKITKQKDECLNISGGYRSFFPNWHFRKLRCNNCDKVIDNERTHCLTTTEGKHICEECLENYKKLMSKNVYDDYIRHLLGINQNREAPHPIQRKQMP